MSRSSSTTPTEHRLSRRRFLHAGAAAVGGALLGPYPASAQPPRITTIDLGGAMLFQGAGCNVIAMAGPEERRQGVPTDNVALMIDGGLAGNADALLTAVKSATRASRIQPVMPPMRSRSGIA